MIPIGAEVRWRPEVHKSGPLGVVTGFPAPRMVEIDGSGQISVGLLEVVGEMASIDYSDENARHSAAVIALEAQRNAMQDEIAALQAVIVQQCEAMLFMVPDEEHEALQDDLNKAVERAAKAEGALKTATDEVTRLEEYAEFAANAADYLEGYMLALYGERRPVRPIEPVELRRLVDFIFEGA